MFYIKGGLEFMKRSYYIYNNGMLKRKDNSIEFLDEAGERGDIFQ